MRNMRIINDQPPIINYQLSTINLKRLCANIQQKTIKKDNLVGVRVVVTTSFWPHYTKQWQKSAKLLGRMPSSQVSAAPAVCPIT